MSAVHIPHDFLDYKYGTRRVHIAGTESWLHLLLNFRTPKVLSTCSLEGAQSSSTRLQMLRTRPVDKGSDSRESCGGRRAFWSPSYRSLGSEPERTLIGHVSMAHAMRAGAGLPWVQELPACCGNGTRTTSKLTVILTGAARSLSSSRALHPRAIAQCMGWSCLARRCSPVTEQSWSTSPYSTRSTCMACCAIEQPVQHVAVKQETMGSSFTW